MEIEFLNKIIFRKFQIIKLIGRGAYSRVFSVRNLANQNILAMKIQDKLQFYGNLENEAYILYHLKGLGIPKIISYGHYGKYNILVMQLLGKSLEQLFKGNLDIKKNIIIKDAILAGIQMIDRIEHIHSKNLLHLDIKPENFLVGEPDSSLLYIIDFGFSKKYKSSRTGKHVQYLKKKYFNGNLMFSSVNTMNGIEPSRRDDLESLGYVLIHLISKELPWKSIPYKSKNEYAQKAYRLKKTISIDTLCKDAPKEMNEFMKYVKSLKFEEDPNYEYLRNLLESVIKQYNYSQFSWVNKSLIKCGRFSSLKSAKKKRISPFSKIFNRLGAKSVVEEKVLTIQIISGLKLNTIENENNYDKYKIDKIKSKNENYKDNIEYENNDNIEDIQKNIYNYNKINLNNQNLIMGKRLDSTQKNKDIKNNFTFNYINQINNNILRLNTYEKKDIFNNNEIYSTIGINTNTLLDKNINFDTKINYKFTTNSVKSKTNNQYSNNSKKLNYSNKRVIHPQYNKKNFLIKKSYNNFIDDKELASSQILNSNYTKNNNELYLNNYRSEAQQNIYQSINNDLYENIVYKREFVK